MIPVFLSKKNYAKAEHAINECIQYPTQGSYNWHLTLFYKAVLGFYSNKPLIALSALHQAEKTPKKFKSAVIDERWKIISAYLSLLNKVGKIHYPKNFRTYRFLNETKPNPTGKINLIIIELLHLLMDGKKKQYMNRVENIESYIQSNLRGKDNARPKYFLRMLRTVEKGRLSPCTCDRSCQKIS